MDKWGGSIYESVHWRLKQKTGHQFKCPTIRMEITKNYDVLLFSCEVVSNSSVNPWTVPTRHLCPLDFPGKSTGVHCHFHFKGSSRLGSSPCFLHCRQILYHWATRSVQSFSRVWLFMTPRTAARQGSLSPPPTPGFHPNPCPLSQWCHPTISSSVIPFSYYPQSFPASGSSQISQLFTSGGQSIGVSASTSVPPMNT